MAGVQYGNVFVLASVGDKVSDATGGSGKSFVIAMQTTAAATVKDGDGNTVWEASGEDNITFGDSCGLPLKDVELDAGSQATLYVYVK